MKSLFVMPVLSVILFAQSAMGVQTYPMKCRPGPKTSFNLSVAGEVRFGFTKATVAAGADGKALKQGECAWVDRAINANEPGHISAAVSPQFKVGAVVPHALNNSFNGYLYASSNAWLYNFSTKDVVLTINVYADGQYFRAPNP